MTTGNFYIHLLLFAFLGWRVGWTEELVRNDAVCNKGHPSSPYQPKQCKWHYITYFPRIFRSGVTENVIFSTHGFPNNVQVEVRVERKYGDKKLFAKVEKEVEPGKLESIPITIPHDLPRSVRVTVAGVGNIEGNKWKFLNSTTVNVENLGLNILVQTDRPIYKPGQTIRARVIVIDPDLKPFVGKLDSVRIENPSESTMRMWKDTPLEDGFASFDLKTSTKPVLGKWKIKVKLSDTYKKVLEIQVQKYVLPKFQVTITPPPFITKMMKVTTAEICAKYSYGKGVYGNLDANICMKKRYGDGEACIKISKRIDGCTTISIDLELLKKRMKVVRYYYHKYILINAKVKERATGVVMTAREAKKDVELREVLLSIESKGVFKPGFPLIVKLFTKYPDGKPIMKSLLIDVHVSGKGFKGDLVKEGILISNGQKELLLPRIPFSAQDLSIRIKYERARLNKRDHDYMRRSTSSKSLTPWYSPSHSYLDIEKLKGPVKIGDKVKVTVGYTSVDSMEVEREITYSMMCAGNLVASGLFKKTFIPAVSTVSTTATTTTTTTTTTPQPTIVFNNKTIRLIVPRPRIWSWTRLGVQATRPPLPSQFSTGEFSFSVDVKRNMLPSCRMVVYYIRNEEVVADETEIEVENEFENQITMEFEKQEVKPGNKLKLTVKGAPNSRIAIAAVDKSIHTLAKGNDIKPQKLIDIRKRLTISPGWVNNNDRCPSRYYGKRKRRSMIWPGYSSNDFVDSEKAFANAGVVILSSLQIDVRPCSHAPTIQYIKYPIGFTVGMAGPRRVLAKGRPEVGKARPKAEKKKKKKKKSAPRARTEFPETWLWTDERLSENGVKVFDVKVPDTITSWYASGFGISKSAGLGVANPTELRVFQPFFISLTLPYSVIRDEDVTIPAAIFSYVDRSCLTVKVTMDFSPDYKMVAGPTAKTCLCGGRTATVLFRLRPKKLGHIKVRITAETLKENKCASNRPFSKNVVAADILERKLLVEPEGIKEEYTRSSFFCTSKKPMENYNTKFKLRLPKNLVRGSIYAKVTAIGDVMGSSLSNVEKLLAMPYGCGEQTMLKFAPNIFIMNYLNNTNQVNVEIKSKALEYMRSGYQRELTYKHTDGSYSIWGNRDPVGSTWLTAFVLKSYAQAVPWIDVDKSEIDATSSWLRKSQDKKGCFPKIGSLHSKAMQGGVKTPATLTAYVLISLLEAGLDVTSSTATAAAKCIDGSFSKLTNDAYSLSIFAYLFAKMNHKVSYQATMLHLDRLAIKEDGMTHWEEEKKAAPKPVPYWYKARSTDIEQTAYVLLAKLQYGGKNAVESSVEIVRWLSKQRNSLGGWSSTQDTVLAMQALAEFAEYAYRDSASMRITVNARQLIHNFEINSDNKLVLQRVEGVPVPSIMKISAEGEGCALVQTNVRYNVKKVQFKPQFQVSHKIFSIDQPLTMRRSCRPQRLEICARWLGDGTSNMAIVDVQMISGFEVDPETFDKIRMKTKGMKSIEVKGKSVVFYFNKIGKTDTCFNFIVTQESNVRKTKPAPIKVYDYYDTGKAATIIYGFSKEHCTGKGGDSMP